MHARIHHGGPRIPRARKSVELQISRERKSMACGLLPPPPIYISIYFVYIYILRSIHFVFHHHYHDRVGEIGADTVQKISKRFTNVAG